MPRPLLLGHRGLRLSGEPAENTIAAFDRALELGCDGFEFDVRLTADRQLVICHDPRHAGCELATVPYGQVAQLPLLQDVLARFAGRAFLDIELKVAGMEESVLAALAGHPPERGFMLSSFFPSILQELQSLNGHLPLGFISDRESVLAHWRDLPVECVVPHFSLLTRELMDEAHQSGRKLMVWTVNNTDEMRRFSDWGVDGIISDDPGLLVHTIQR